jgi:SAM-dependent methyltransferase/putative flippase GtrA
MEDFVQRGVDAPVGRGVLRGTLARNSIAAAVAVQAEYLVYFFLIAETGLHYLAASLMSTSGGILVGFFATKYWAFARRDQLRRHVGLYLAVVGVGIGLGLGGLFALSVLASVSISVARPLADLAVYCAWMYPANLFIFAFRPGEASYRTKVQARYDDLSSELYGSEQRRPLLGWLWKRLINDRQMRVVMSMVRNHGRIALDVGCGSGHYSRELKRLGMTVTAVDIAPLMLNEARTFADEIVLGDVESLDLRRSFDLVICIGVLDFVADIRIAMRALARHLAPGGRLIVLVPVRTPFVIPYYFDQLRRGIRVNLLGRRVLDRAASESGLRLVASARPLPHNLVLAWERPS